MAKQDLQDKKKRKQAMAEICLETARFYNANLFSPQGEFAIEYLKASSRLVEGKIPEISNKQTSSLNFVIRATIPSTNDTSFPFSVCNSVSIF